MIRTFDFIFVLLRSEEKREQVCLLMEQAEDVEYDIDGWHLGFDQKRMVVTVTNNGTDEYLKSKFIPAEISYRSLKELMRCDENDNNDERIDGYEINYLW